MNSVIGAFVTFFMGQMAILTIPLRLYQPEVGYKPIQAVVRSKSDIKWQNIDPRISSIEIECPSIFDYLYYLEIPAHRPFTEILLNMSKLAPDVKIHSIGDVSASMAAKLEYEHPRQLDILSAFNGKIVDTYIHPGANINYAITFVHVNHILHFLKTCQEKNLKVVQIFDFFE